MTRISYLMSASLLAISCTGALAQSVPPTDGHISNVQQNGPGNINNSNQSDGKRNELWLSQDSTAVVGAPGNSFKLEQVGDDNKVGSESKRAFQYGAGNSVDISKQEGKNNTIDLTQKGTENGTFAGSANVDLSAAELNGVRFNGIYQGGKDNAISVDQTGTRNMMDIAQSGEGNKATLGQANEFNLAIIKQDAATRGATINILQGEVTVDGSYGSKSSFALAFQESATSTASGLPSMIDIMQYGSWHKAYVFQKLVSDSQARVQQEGYKNTINAAQADTANAALDIRQVGEKITARADQNSGTSDSWVLITQSGNYSSVDVQQSGATSGVKSGQPTKSSVDVTQEAAESTVRAYQLSGAAKQMSIWQLANGSAVPGWKLWANVGQGTGDRSTMSITQSGQNNAVHGFDTELGYTNRDSVAMQWGDDQTLTITQQGFFNTIAFSQTGSANEAVINQTAYRAKASVDQSHDGKRNYVELNQFDNDNKDKLIFGGLAEVIQRGGTGNSVVLTEQAGDNSIFVARQEWGEGNTISATQKGPSQIARVAQYGSGSNGFSITQTDGYNRIQGIAGLDSSAIQSGYLNRAYLTQTGNNNTISLEQTGDENTTTINQATNFNQVYSHQKKGGNKTTVNQGGGDYNYVRNEQFGLGGETSFTQTGMWNSASVLQETDGNKAFIVQSGNYNTVGVTQKDGLGGNTTSITQTGDKNVAYLTQTGGIGNSYTIKQDGNGHRFNQSQSGVGNISTSNQSNKPL